MYMHRGHRYLTFHLFLHRGHRYLLFILKKNILVLLSTVTILYYLFLNSKPKWK